MRTLLASALALGATASLALAEPAVAADLQPGLVELTDAQLDQITAGAGASQPPGQLDTHWGDLTSAVAGPGLGEHASGEGTPRVGLANIGYALLDGERGDLAATVEFIDGLGGILP